MSVVTRYFSFLFFDTFVYSYASADGAKTAFLASGFMVLEQQLLRRLVLGNKINNTYPNIEQIARTGTGIISSHSDPTKLSGVFARTAEGDMTLAAALVINLCIPHWR